MYGLNHIGKIVLIVDVSFMYMYETDQYLSTIGYGS